LSSRKRKNKDIKVTKPKRFLLWLLVLMLIVASVLLMNSSIFDVKEILVYGNGTYDQSYIIDRSGITIGENILKVDEPAAKQNLEEDPFIEVKDIKRCFPASVEIYMEQRTAYMQAEYNGGFLVLDRKAHLLMQKPTKDDFTLLISGLNLKEPVLGKTIESNAEQQIEQILVILDNADSYGISSSLTGIDMSDQTSILMKMKGNIIVNLGFADDIDKKLALYAPSIESVKDKLSLGGTLDLSVENKAYFTENQPTPTPKK